MHVSELENLEGLDHNGNYVHYMLLWCSCQAPVKSEHEVSHQTSVRERPMATGYGLSYTLTIPDGPLAYSVVAREVASPMRDGEGGAAPEEWWHIHLTHTAALTPNPKLGNIHAG